MITNLKTLSLFALLTLMLLPALNLSAQNKEPDLKELLEKSREFEEIMIPDSIISITEQVLLHDYDKTQYEYEQIIQLGIVAAIFIQNVDLVTKYSNQILGLDSYKNNPEARGNLYLNIATNYLNMHEYNHSMHYCSAAFKTFEEIGISAGISYALMLMYDNSYFSQEDSTNTSYLDQAVKIAEENADSALLSNVYFAVGKAYYRSNNYKNAISNYELAKKYTPQLNLGHYLGICIYQHLVYTLCDSVNKACELASYILDKSLTNGLHDYLSNAYLGSAFCSAKKGYIDSTKMFLDLSEEWRSKTPKVKASPGYFNQMYKVSMLISDYDRALRYLEIQADQENKINRKNKASVLGDARAEFDYLLQKAKINELRALNDASEEKSKRRKTTIMGIAAILLISFVAFLNSKIQYKNLNYSYKNLVKKHVEVDKLNNQLLKEKKKKEIRKSGVFIKDEDEILENLLHLLNYEKVYKDPNVSLVFLANKLGTNTSYLSTIINKHFNINFKSLINKYRIDEARKILVSEKGADYSIDGVSNEVGFQSRSVFYQTFRQFTGLTPTNYVKSYKSVCPDS